MCLLFCCSDYEALESATGACVQQLVTVAGWPGAATRRGESSTVYSQLHDAVSDCINTYGGLHGFTTDALRTELCQITAHLYR